MTQNYAELIKELYEQKFINQQTHSSSYDRVKLIQKKMNQNINKNKEKLSFSLKLKDHQEYSTYFDEAESQTSKKVLKNTKYKPQFFETTRTIVKHDNKNKKDQANEFYTLKTSPRTNSILYKPNTTSQRQNFLVDYIKQKSFPIIVQQIKTQNVRKVRRSAPMTAQGTRRQSAYKRATTPSKNVFIAGCNLEQEAQAYRKQFKQLDLQIKRYNKQLQLKEKQKQLLKSAAKQQRNLKQQKKGDGIGIRKQNMLIKQSRQIMKKLEDTKQTKEKTKYKEQILQLLPWTVLVPQYQYY